MPSSIDFASLSDRQLADHIISLRKLEFNAHNARIGSSAARCGRLLEAAWREQDRRRR